jgi:hypothetical protein
VAVLYMAMQLSIIASASTLQPVDQSARLGVCA